MPMVADRACGVAVPPLRLMTLGWVMKRALLGLAILFVTMGSVAWLTYASIDPNIDTVPGDAAKAPAGTQATDAHL